MQIDINCLDYAVHAAKEVSERGFQPILASVNTPAGKHAVAMWIEGGFVHVKDNGIEYVTKMTELPK